MAYILAQQQIRQAVVTALQTTGIAQVVSPGDTTLPDGRLAVIQVRSPSARKDQDGKGPLSFTTTVDIEIECKCSSSSGATTQTTLEQLVGQIECSLIPCHDLMRLVNCITSWSCSTAYTSEAKDHIGEAKIAISFELPELFDPLVDYLGPSVAVPLDGIDLHADLANVYDGTGIYSNPAFPDSTLPAPRTSGPDGRDEGALSIDLSGD